MVVVVAELEEEEEEEVVEEAEEAEAPPRVQMQRSCLTAPHSLFKELGDGCSEMKCLSLTATCLTGCSVGPGERTGGHVKVIGALELSVCVCVCKCVCGSVSVCVCVFNKDGKSECLLLN